MMGNRRLLSRLGLLALLLGLATPFQTARSEGLPRVAVTDLSYEEKVSEHFSYVKAHSKSDSAAGFDHGTGAMASSQESSYEAAEGTITTIERGELHKFTNDIRGALVKSQNFRVVQGHPFPHADDESFHDIIARIKGGFYPDADYVLFGSLNDINGRTEALPIQGTNAVNFVASLELVGEFSLINTTTFEVVAGFTAMGEGSDSRLINSPNAQISFNRGKVIQEVSRSLGAAVAAEVDNQFTAEHRASGPRNSREQDNSREGQTVTYR